MNFEFNDCEFAYYRPVKGQAALRGFFTVTLLPMGLKISGMRHFHTGEKAWITFPQEIISKPTDEKKKWMSLIRFVSKPVDDSVKELILEQLEAYLEKQESTDAKENVVQSDPSALWF